ncbi:MAG: hypothetical protein M3270_02750 [Thermoproteota archaeon]|nr:hypothetical protein [Thermoproteota archaeon]
MKKQYHHWSDTKQNNANFDLLVLVPIIVSLLLSSPLIGAKLEVIAYDNHNTEKKETIGISNTAVQISPFLATENKMLGAYIPDTLHLEDMNGEEQRLAILKFLQEGFNEYYFVMDNFWDLKELQSTERLLDVADKTGLDIIIILLPPSEGGSTSTYDWKGWIAYFNSLKARHPSSFTGFAIDDFNWISTRNDTKFWRNIDFMLDSNLTDALKEKRTDVKFCPVIYFEGLGDQILTNKFSRYIDTIVLVSASYYNVSNLETNLLHFKEMLQGKSTRYIVYPTITYNYTRQGYDPPSDRLVMATLSIATRLVDGIIFWHKIDGPIVQDYLQNIQNPDYLKAIYAMEQLQMADEKNIVRQPVSKQVSENS